MTQHLEDAQEAIEAIHKATMKLTGYGENDTSYLQKPRKLIAAQQKEIAMLRRHYEELKLHITTSEAGAK